jgi:ADP-ribosyl-[dinitrogen reductase] hydrolase
LHGAFMNRSLNSLREREVNGFIERFPEFKFDNGRVSSPTGYIVDTIKAVFQAMFANNGFETAMVDVVNRGGDADTTGAILGMIVGALYGKGAIPKRWLKQLDKNVKHECEAQALELIRMGAK